MQSYRKFSTKKLNFITNINITKNEKREREKKIYA